MLEGFPALHAYEVVGFCRQCFDHKLPFSRSLEETGSRVFNPARVANGPISVPWHRGLRKQVTGMRVGAISLSMKTSIALGNKSVYGCIELADEMDLGAHAKKHCFLHSDYFVLLCDAF